LVFQEKNYAILIRDRDRLGEFVRRGRWLSGLCYLRGGFHDEGGRGGGQTTD
jgi:hypothetical protein